MIGGLGYKTYEKLIKKFKNMQGIWNASKEELQSAKIKTNVIENILDKKIRNIIKKHLNFMRMNDIDIIYIEDKEYPEKLKQIYDPPICLYIKGNKEILNNKSIAIIGCRDYSEYGKYNAIRFSNELAKNKINIVSGLAKGIDSFAHFGAIKAKEKTVAVLGNSLDMIYPSENKKLAEEIIKTGGALISEYALGTKPSKYTFPARNRIISGMSEGVLVIEAKEKSGTLITVDFALEQGREVYAIPGNIYSQNSIGTNEIIKQGAIVVTEVEDMLKIL